MGEYFEITFFLSRDIARLFEVQKKLCEVLGINGWRNHFSEHKLGLFRNREALFDAFEYNDANYVEYRICVDEIHLTHNNFQQKVTEICEVVDVCFRTCKDIQFATGMYEISYLQFENINSIECFSEKVLSKFPFLFFRKGHERNYVPLSVHGEVSVIYNQDAQDVFEDPIGELMEDNNISFDEAKRRLGLS